MTMSAFICVQLGAGIIDYFQRLAQIKANMNDNLISKGNILAANNSVALRGMAVDNAFLAVSELVVTTVKEDRDIAYGIYMDNKRVPWVMATPGSAIDKTGAAPLNDSVSLWASSISDVSLRKILKGNTTIMEIAAPVIVEGQRMGTIRYGISTEGIDKAANDMKKQALVQSLVQPLIFFCMGVLIYLFVFRLSRRQADEIARPLQELTNAANTMAAGNYSVSLRATTGDEIGVLARNFESMRRTIYTYTTRLEQMVGKRTEQLENKNQELQEFARIASHDLQEPLRKIRAFGDRLKAKLSGNLDEQSVDYLARMISAATRMQNLIDGLLAYSRVTTKASPFAKTDLAVIVKEVISDLEIRISETGGRVDVGEMVSLDADELQMRQLLQNLIGNGLKYHKKDVPPIIKVFSRIVEPKGEEGQGGEPTVEIVVEDNGIGISEEHFEKIFVVFQRLHSRDSEYEGSGIGLSVVKKIADRHEGDIKVESKVGEWTRFIVSLPLHQSEIEPASAES
jgi:Bacteriophytochrome (light-regulated signal transduction histidine kinase)